MLKQSLKVIPLILVLASCAAELERKYPNGKPSRASAEMSVDEPDPVESSQTERTSAKVDRSAEKFELIANWYQDQWKQKILSSAALASFTKGEYPLVQVQVTHMTPSDQYLSLSQDITSGKIEDSKSCRSRLGKKKWDVGSFEAYPVIPQLSVLKSGLEFPVFSSEAYLTYIVKTDGQGGSSCESYRSQKTSSALDLINDSASRFQTHQGAEGWATFSENRDLIIFFSEASKSNSFDVNIVSRISKDYTHLSYTYQLKPEPKSEPRKPEKKRRKR
ncbi:hypothetical protein K2X30_11220 [bacterium]|nr:hypothetical protein [bacterium]